MCLAAIHLARIARLVFAASTETAATFGFDSRHLHDRLREPRALPTTQLLADEGSAALRLGARNASPGR